MRRIAFFIICVMFWAPTGCRRGAQAPKPGDLVQRPENPSVAYVADDDPRLKQASAEAQKTLPAFVKELEGPRPTQGNFAIKAALRESGRTSEAVWLTGLHYDGRTFHGAVSNEPVHLKNIHLGSKVSVAADKVADWMFVENGKLHGGYTLRVLREVLIGDARVQFEQSMPFAFD